MNRTLVATMSGLIFVGVAREGVAATTATEAANNRFSSLKIILPQLLENLRVMINSNAAAPQKAKTDAAK